MPTDDQVKQILLSAMTAPSANSLHPVEYVVIKNSETIKKLAKCGKYQQFLEGAPVVIAVIGDPEVSPRFWLVDTSIAAGYIYLECVNQGLATCWANVYEGTLEDGGNREDYVRNVLKIPSDKRPVCLFPVGKAAENIADHNESEFVFEKIHKESW